MTPKQAQRFLTKRLPHFVLFGLVAAVYLFGGFAFLDDKVTDTRYRLASHDASGSLVLVMIDAASIRDLEVWPWPRDYHAVVLDRLLAAGATRVAFDIDFSSRSDPAADTALAEALERAEGRAVLPVFQQLTSEQGQSEFVVTLPHEEFRDHAALASINVRPASDGTVRRMWMTFESGDQRYPSMAASLADLPYVSFDSFDIDFSIDPETIPVLSFADVLAGRFDPAAVAGRQVLIGATAVELGDQLTAPVYSVLPGPVMQVLAYESLVLNRAIRHAGPAVIVGLLFLTAMLLGPLCHKWTWTQGLAAAAGMIALGYGITFAIQYFVPVNVAFVPFAFLIFLSYGYCMINRLDRQALRIFVQSVTDMHRRQMMKSVVESTSDGIVIVNHDGRIDAVNPAAEEMFGAAADEAKGQKLSWLLPSSDDGMPQNGTTEVTLQRADGSSIAAEVTINALKLKSSRHRLERRQEDRDKFILTLRDITARKEIEEARKKALDEAVAANRAKSEFLAAMGHELRTPLNGIIGFSEVLEANLYGDLNEKQTECVRDILQSGRRLLNTFNDILDVASIESGRVELREDDVDLVDIVESCSRTFEDQAADGEIELRVIADKDLPEVWADQQRLQQVVHHLVSNAIKFTNEGGNVTLMVNREGDEVVFSVKDTGIGMATDDIDKALAPFGQVDSRLSRKYEGNGLGLTLARKLTEMHDGRLEITSMEGRGTTVRVVLPKDRVRPAPEARPAPAQREDAAVPSPPAA